MNRQEVVIALAKVNYINIQISSWLELGKELESLEEISDIDAIPRLCKDVLIYLNSSPSVNVINYIDTLHTTDYLTECLNNKSIKFDGLLKNKLLKVISSINSLIFYADSFKKNLDYGPYQNLQEEFHSEKALELFRRAVNAGYLNDDFTLKQSMTQKRTKILAWAIGQTLKIKKRKQWITFERQWLCERIQCVDVSGELKQDDTNLMKLYADVDYSPLFTIHINEYFYDDGDINKREKLFLSLLTYGYIAKDTKYSDFARIFHDKYDNKIIHPIQWIGNARQFAYFISTAFKNNTKNVWEASRNCFLLRGKTINIGTLKSAKVSLNNYSSSNTYDSCLYMIAKEFSAN